MKKNYSFYLVFLLLILTNIGILRAQSDSCYNATPFCDSVNQYAAIVNGPTAPFGNNYGCLITQPNPTFFTLTVSTSGTIDITLLNTAGVDIDYILWGPYANLTAAQNSCGNLGNGGVLGNVVDTCSYSNSAIEFVQVSNAVAGSVYILMITNFANAATDIFSTSNSGSGSIACPCDIVFNFDTLPAPINQGYLTDTSNLLGQYVVCPGDQLGIQITAGGNPTDTLQIYAPYTTINTVFPAASLFTATGLPNDTISIGAIINPTQADVGTHTFDLSIQSSTPTSLCQDVIPIEVIVPGINLRDTTICSGDSILIPIDTFPTTYVGFAHYQWTQIAGTPATLSNDTLAQPSISAPPLAVGVLFDSIVMEVQFSYGGCITVDTISIIVIGVPDGSFFYPDTVYCQQGPTPVPIVTGTPGGSFSSNTGVVFLSSASGAIDIANTPPGTHPIFYELTSPGGQCDAKDTFIIEVTGITTFEASSSSYFICPNVFDTLQLNLNVVYGGITPASPLYTWTPTAPLSSSSIANPTAILLGPDTFVVSYDDGICAVQTDTIAISAPYPVNLSVTSPVTVCNGDTVQLGAVVAAGPGNQNFNLSSPATLVVEDTTFVNLNITGVAPSTVNAALLSSMELCMDLSVSTIGHLSIYLVAPSGEIAAITNRHGGFGTTLVGAIFSTDPSNTSIAPYLAPFPSMPANTNFLPLGGITGFNNLLGASTNGTWTLMIIHDNGNFSTINGTVNNWCLNFQDLSQTTLFWEPNYNISCTACDSPFVYPSVDTNYFVIAQNDFGCIDTAAIAVLIGAAIPAPSLSCGTQTPNSVTFNWNLLSGVSGYSVSVNGGTAQIIPATQDSFTVTGLAANQCAQISIFALSGTSCADGSTDSITCCATGCTSIDPIVISSSGPTSFCPGQNTTLDAGTGFVSYLWSTGETTQNILVNGTQLSSVTTTDIFGCLDTGSISTLLTPGPLPTISPSGGTDLCAGETVDLDAGNGFSTYSWSDGSSSQLITASSSGTYQLTVTDTNGCEGYDSLAVNIASSINIILSPTNLSCNSVVPADGSILSNSTGGYGTYSYLWNNGQSAALATGLTTGNYTLTVTDLNGCSATASVSVSEPSAVTVTSTSTDALCNGNSDGTATATALGGTGGYSYVWSTLPGQSTAIATGLNAATSIYTVTASDANNCTATSSVTVSEPSIITATIVTTAASCNGGDDGLATINAAGGTPSVPNAYTYDWGLGFVTSTSSPGAPFGTAGVQSVVVSDANGCTISENYTITEPAAISFTVGSTDASCNGYSDGSASINVSGGLGGFSYTWSTSAQTTATATGLSAGQHCVTVSDGNGCTVDTCITVSEPTGFSTPTFNTIDVSCFGLIDGQLSVTVTGAIAPYSYLWSAGGQTTQTAVGLSAIVHTVTISDANGCTVTGNAAVVEPTAIQVSLNVDSVQCKNGSNGQIAATASGGSFPYTYLWDANASNQNTAIATGLSIGTYSLTVTDFNGCTLSTSAEVFEPLTILTASIINSSNPLCNGVCDGSIEVDALGATPNYTYQWNNGQTSSIATGLCSGVQSVTVSDQNNCTVTTSGVLSDPPLLSVLPSVVSNFNGAAISCPGANDGSVQVTASGGTGTLNYTWSPNGQNTALISNLLADNYCVSVSDQNGCQVDTCIEIVDPVLLAASFVKVDILCHGDANGQILVTATPGTGTIGINGYEYRIVGPGQSGTVFSSINSFSNLAAGNYIVTVRDGNNCEVDLAIAIVEPSPVVFAALSTTDALCNGGSSGTATATISGGTAGYSFVWSGSSQTVQTASGLAAGVYSVTASDANGCDVVDVFTIDEPTALIGTVSSSNIACIGGVATATAIASGGSPIGLTSYLYNWSNGQTASTAVNLSAGQQCVTITDNNTCTVVNCITISEPSTAVGLSISGQTAAGCNGSADGTATAQGNGGTAGYSYVWQTVPAQSTQTATGLSAGVYVVAVSDSNGCNATASVTISDPSGISATISGTTDASCNGSADGTATAQGSGGTPGYSYLWSDGQTNNTATGISAGAYTVIVTDANGCSISIAATIVAPTAVNITQLLSTDVACKGDADGTASLSMNGGTAPYSFTWSGAVGQTGFVATGLSAGSQTVTATDANGCSTVDTFVINEPAQGMSGLLVGQDALCDGVSNGELGAIVQGGTGSYSYLWSDGQTTVVADLIAAGSYSLTVTDASGCALVLNGSIGQASAVSVTASVQQSVTCAGGSDAIAVAQSASGGTPDYSYVWSDALGQTGQTANGLTVGIYTVVATDSNFCTGSSTVTITEPTAMTVVASIDDASCNGLSDGQINIVSSNKVIANYSWSAGLGNPLLGLSAGTYELTATDVDGCQDSFSYSVTEPDALLSDIALQSSISCNGSADGAAIVSSSGGSPSYTYAWNNGTSGNSLSNLGPGNYTVTVTDAKGCTETESISLSEPNELTISGSTTGTLCAGDATGIIEASGLGGTVVVGMLEYSLDGSSWQQGNLFSGLTSGIYDLQVRDENGCIASTQVVVEDADPLFISAMTPNLSVEYLDSISISATLNDTTGVSYSWTQLEGSTLGLITDSSYQFEINPIEKVSYLFSATNSRGCRVDSIVIIEVRKPRRASAPTGFTPNGDGVNDYFFVQGGEKIAEVALFRVYDRWGSLVFEGQSLEVNIAEQGWNGSFRGQECSSGAYTWYADIRFKDGETTQLKGEVVLLR